MWTEQERQMLESGEGYACDQCCEVLAVEAYDNFSSTCRRCEAEQAEYSAQIAMTESTFYQGGRR